MGKKLRIPSWSMVGTLVLPLLRGHGLILGQGTKFSQGIQCRCPKFLFLKNLKIERWWTHWKSDKYPQKVKDAKGVVKRSAPGPVRQRLLI